MFSMWHALCIWLAVAYDPSEYRQKGWKLKIVCFGKHGTHFFKKIMYMSNTVFGVNKQSIEKDFWKQKVEMKNLKMPKLKTWKFWKCLCNYYSALSKWRPQKRLMFSSKKKRRIVFVKIL